VSQNPVKLNLTLFLHHDVNHEKRHIVNRYNVLSEIVKEFQLKNSESCLTITSLSALR